MVARHLYLTKIIVILLIFSFSTQVSISQDEKSVKKSKTYLRLHHYKRTDGNRELVAILKTKVNKKFTFMEGAELTFKSVTDTSQDIITKINCNSVGEAKLLIEKDAPLPLDTAGFCTYEVSYKGSQEYKPVKKSISVKDVNLHIEFTEIDSVKTVVVTGNSINGTGTEKPLHDETIIISAQRLFSRLPLKEGEMNDGTCFVEFPSDLPGDTLGNILVYAQIEDHDSYGNVEKSGIITWGIPVTEKESYKSSFSGRSYIIFLSFSLVIVLVIIGFSRRKATV